MINIALPKGRLGEQVYGLFEKAGYGCPSIREKNRKLIFESLDGKVSYFWVKPSDVAIYVERGAADIGVAGSDILHEYQPDLFEILDLGVGVCRMCVAGKPGFEPDPFRPIRVATKFPRTAKAYYGAASREIDIIKLHGSIEIAPLLGLSDVIVDIVETGATLRENGLVVLEEIMPISARLIANKVSAKFQFEAIDRLRADMEKQLGGKNENV